jgi:DNA modification methylase
VWWLAPAQFREGHFATMPPTMAEICIVAGSRHGDTVLDPFGGAGTTGLVADRLSRHALLIELNPKYAEMARARIQNETPLLADVEVA